MKWFLNANHLAFMLGMLGMCSVANTSLCLLASLFWHRTAVGSQLLSFLWTFCSFSNSYTRNELIFIVDGTLFSLAVPSQHQSWRQEGPTQSQHPMGSPHAHELWHVLVGFTFPLLSFCASFTFMFSFSSVFQVGVKPLPQRKRQQTYTLAQASPWFCGLWRL